MLHLLLGTLLGIYAGLTAGDQQLLSKTSYTHHLKEPAEIGTRIPAFSLPGASPSQKRRVRRELALHGLTQEPASDEQFQRVWHLLAKQKVDPNMPTASRFKLPVESSPLCNAAFRGNFKLVHLLLSFRADPNALSYVQGKKGKVSRSIAVTPLISAVRGHKKVNYYEGFYPETIAMLQRYGAHINDGGESEELPFNALHSLALLRGNPILTAAKLNTLLGLGADPLKPTFQGWTARQIAHIKMGNRDLANCLGCAESLCIRERVSSALAMPVEPEPKRVRIIKQKKKSSARRQFARLKGSSQEVLHAIEGTLLP